MVKLVVWPGVIGWIGVLLIVLKLSGLLAWSWWAVLAPFWAPAVFIALVFAAIATLSWAFD